jgi:hypothetical protein
MYSEKSGTKACPKKTLVAVHRPHRVVEDLVIVGAVLRDPLAGRARDVLAEPVTDVLDLNDLVAAEGIVQNDDLSAVDGVYEIIGQVLVFGQGSFAELSIGISYDTREVLRGSFFG